jgi:hypothetical protein
MWMDHEGSGSLLFMKGNPLVVIMLAVVCIITVVAATIWLATEGGVPSETAVPMIVVVLLALRLAAKRRARHASDGHIRRRTP